MKINELKTKSFVVGASEQDMEPPCAAGLEVPRCRQYTCHGATFTTGGSAHQAVRTHAHAMTAHTATFVSFSKKNNDVPFMIKKSVWCRVDVCSSLRVRTLAER